jgi:hypothetical protein
LPKPYGEVESGDTNNITHKIKIEKLKKRGGVKKSKKKPPIFQKGVGGKILKKLFSLSLSIEFD